MPPPCHPKSQQRRALIAESNRRDGKEWPSIAVRSRSGSLAFLIVLRSKAIEGMPLTRHGSVSLLPSYLNLNLPYGLVPTEATIGSYEQKYSARALHRVYSVEATFGSEKRCFHRYETGGEPWPVSAASSHQLSPHWHKASGSETQEKMLHSVAYLGQVD